MTEHEGMDEKTTRCGYDLDPNYVIPSGIAVEESTTSVMGRFGIAICLHSSGSTTYEGKL
jgi:hypothetical protein